MLEKKEIFQVLPNDLVMINQRRLHNTQYGIFDCVDSPDGSNIGIKKHVYAKLQNMFNPLPENGQVTF